MYPFVNEQTPAIDDQEIGRLHAFRDMLVLSKKLWKPKKNISLALLSAVLEGKEAKYVPGGMSKPSTKNREQIFFQEVDAKEKTDESEFYELIKNQTLQTSQIKKIVSEYDYI